MKISTTTAYLFQLAYPFNFTTKIVSGYPISTPSRFSLPANFPPICSGMEKRKWVSINVGTHSNHSTIAAVTDNGEQEREVECEVEVISWRERRIKAELLVNADVQSVRKALTDYERLADFIPNLVSSQMIPCPHPGHVWVEQIGLQRALYWNIEARVVLDLQEFRISENHLEIRFSKVEGDFKKFEGKWSVKSGIRPSTAILSYEVEVIPAFNFPAIFLEKIIRSQLPVNLLAVARQSESDFEGRQCG